jgi:hypothetical protein
MNGNGDLHGRASVLVTFNVQVVVLVGVVVTVPPLTPPSASMKSYWPLLVFHVSVTAVPAATDEAEDVKLLIVRVALVGAFGVVADERGCHLHNFSRRLDGVQVVQIVVISACIRHCLKGEIAAIVGEDLSFW